MGRLAGILLAKPRRTLLSFGVVVLLAVLVTGRLRLEQDIFAFLPTQSRPLQTLAHIFKTSMDNDKVIVLVRSRDGRGDPVALGDKLAGDMLSLTVGGEPAFTRASSLKTEALGPDALENLLGLFAQRPELFLTESDRKEIRRFLASPQDMESEIARTLAYLAAPGTGGKALGVILDDPLNFRRFLIDKLPTVQTGMSLGDGPRLLSRDGRALLIMAVPTHSPRDRAWALDLLAGFDALKAANPGAAISFAGGWTIAAQEEAMIRGDLVSSMVVSTLSIALVFFLAYRRVSVMFLVLLPIGVGLQFALGVLAGVWGTAHMLAAAFASAIIGLALDYSILIYDRYTFERAGGASSQEAARRTMTTTGGAVAACALTTGASFWVLTLVDSPVLRQIGWLVTLGVLFCMAATVWVLPAWLAWRERGGPAEPLFVPSRLNLDRPAAWIAAHKGPALGVALGVLALTLPGLGRLSFEFEPSALQPRGLESLRAQQEIRACFGQERLLLVTWNSRDNSTFWRHGEGIDEALKALTASGQVSGWSSITALSGGPWNAPISCDLGVVSGLLTKYGLKPEEFGRLFSFLEKLGQTRPAESGCAFFNAYPTFLRRFFICAQNGVQGVTWATLTENGSQAEVERRVTAVDRTAAVFDPDASVQGLMSSAGSSLWVMVGWATALVLAILAVFFRNARDPLYSLVPPVLGIVATVGVMGYLGIRINIINVIYIPILIGIGSDLGIVFVDRYRETRDMRMVIATAGKSVVMSTLCACLGFGSLATARYHVLSDMGLLTILGLGGCCFFTLMALPALLTPRPGR